MVSSVFFSLPNFPALCVVPGPGFFGLIRGPDQALGVNLWFTDSRISFLLILVVLLLLCSMGRHRWKGMDGNVTTGLSYGASATKIKQG